MSMKKLVKFCWHMLSFLLNCCTFIRPDNVTTGLTNFTFENFKNLTTNIKSQTRVCTSNFPCIRICCLGEHENDFLCVTTKTLAVPTLNGSEIIDFSANKYYVIEGKPCGNMFILEPQEEEKDRWYFQVRFLYFCMCNWFCELSFEIKFKFMINETFLRIFLYNTNKYSKFHIVLNLM